MTARGGFDLAQLDTSFLADPKFVRLARRVPDDQTFLACVGAWTIMLAKAWASDDPDIHELLTVYPAEGAWLADVGLVHGVELVGFEAKVAKLRARRAADAARKRTDHPPPDSTGVHRSPLESDGLQREVVVEVEVEERGGMRDVLSGPLTSPPRAMADGPKHRGLRPVAERRAT